MQHFSKFANIQLTETDEINYMIGDHACRRCGSTPTLPACVRGVDSKSIRDCLACGAPHELDGAPEQPQL